VEKGIEKRGVKVPAGEEESPEQGRSSILWVQREKPLLLWRRGVKVFLQEESLGGAGMQKIGTRSFPPPWSCKSFTLPSEPAIRSGKLKEKKFIV
jgi:hypothetical protein